MIEQNRTIPVCGYSCSNYKKDIYNSEERCVVLGHSRTVHSGERCHPEILHLLKAIELRQQQSLETAAA